MMDSFIEYQKDLEDAFKLDCSEEDIRTDKEAKRCFKMLKKSRRRAEKYRSFLCKCGFISKYRKKKKWWLDEIHY